MTPANVFSTALEVRDFAERLPGRMNRILDALRRNDLRLKIEVIDHGSIIDGLQKVANRIALGVVLAALIVGAAMLMRVETPLHDPRLSRTGDAAVPGRGRPADSGWRGRVLAGDVKARTRISSFRSESARDPRVPESPTCAEPLTRASAYASARHGGSE